MVKKLKAMAEGAGKDNQLAAAIKESAQQIWLAGLGAFAKTQEEGQKVFQALVKEGTSIQKRTVRVTEDRIGDIGGRFANACAWFDRNVVDGIVNSIGALTRRSGTDLARVQTGRVQNYALGIALGLIAMAGSYFVILGR